MIYVEHFWQTTNGGAGFREYPKSMPEKDWYYDVDSGPVIYGYGFAASAFGIAAARINGRFDHAWPMSAEALVSSCPLLDGTMLGPRILSNASDAPYLGEACMLFILSTQPHKGVGVVEGGSIPLYFYVILAGYFTVALWLVVPVLINFVKLARGKACYTDSKLAGIVWLLAVSAGIANYVSSYNSIIVYIVAFLLMIVFPSSKSRVKNNHQGSGTTYKDDA